MPRPDPGALGEHPRDGLAVAVHDGGLVAALELPAGGLDAKAQVGVAARRLAGDALEAAHHWGTPGAIGEALCGLARIDDGSDAVEVLREALGLFEQSPARVLHAQALVDLGSALRRRGSRRESRVPLREGLALAQACAADGVAERARRELAASGVRVSRDKTGGTELLTASERRIAELAATGASNAEIAQSLFVTVKTVEFHLTHSYRKLGITKRTELDRALRGEGSTAVARDEDDAKARAQQPLVVGQHDGDRTPRRLRLAYGRHRRRVGVVVPVHPHHRHRGDDAAQSQRAGG